MFKYIIRKAGYEYCEWCGSGLKEAKEALKDLRKDHDHIYLLYKWNTKKSAYVPV